jgi:hypothetical protein
MAWVLLPTTVKLALLPEQITEAAGCDVTATGLITVSMAAVDVAGGGQVPVITQR